MTEIITLSQAKARGLTNYFTGKPCKHGHISERNTSTRTCRECQWQRWLKAKEKARLIREANPKPLKTREEKLAYQKSWASMNKDKTRAAQKRYADKKPGKMRAKWARRRKSVIRATPKWLTDDQRKQIEEIYASRPEGYHVDHIVPLRGRNVCGLHVPWNLQHLPDVDNLKKSNSF